MELFGPFVEMANKFDEFSTSDWVVFPIRLVSSGVYLANFSSFLSHSATSTSLPNCIPQSLYLVGFFDIPRVSSVSLENDLNSRNDHNYFSKYFAFV